MSTWSSAFSAIQTALGAISAAASIPGVNLIPYVSTVTAAANAISAGLNAAVNVAPYIAAVAKTFTGGLPTDVDLAALDAKIADLEALGDAALPPKEDGEPEGL